MISLQHCRFYGKANPLKKTNPSQKAAAPQKQRLLSRKKTEGAAEKTVGTNQRKDVKPISEFLAKKTPPIELQPDQHVENRFNISNLVRQKGYNVVDIAKSWTMYKRKVLNERTSVEHAIALTRDKSVSALASISKKLAMISVSHDYSLPPTSRRIATYTKPLRLPFIY